LPAASGQSAAAPPPVPLYSAGAAKTTVFGPGMIVIDTKDSFETVRDWYQTNLKDRTADVALDSGHHRYVTHDGASVDVATEGSGPDAGTKISLFWKADAGMLASPRPASSKPVAEPAPAESVHPLAALAEIKPASPVTAPQIAMAAPARIEPLAVRPADAVRSERKALEPQGATYLKQGRYGEALLAWEDAAANGSAAAALSLGMMYDAGLGVPQNYGSAFSWYEVAAEQGDPVAIYNIGVLNDAGLGLSRNPTEALDRYTQAAAKGIGRAAFNLALLYERGDGVEQDDREAEQYFRKAERLGVRAARAHLPTRRGLRQVDADDSDLPFNTIHSIGGDAPEKHPADAARLQDQAARGDPVALYDLAYNLEKGIGEPADPHGAYMMYRQAAHDARDDRLRAVANAAAAHLAGAGRAQ
jgi:TPR repeat protein